MLPLIPLLVQLASAVPALMKYAGAGERSTEIAEQAVGIAQAITGVKDPTTAVNQVLADPVKMAEFQLKANEQLMTWDSLFLADVQSARNRDIELAKTGYRNIRGHSMYVLAVVMIGLLVWQVLVSDTLNEYAKGIITLVLGRFLGYLDNIYNFEFGTTRSSQQKDQTIKQLTNGKGHG